MSRSRLAAAGVGILVIALGAAAWLLRSKPPVYTGPVERITAGSSSNSYSLLLLIAQERGFFAQNGLSVKMEEYESGRLAVTHLLQGDVDLATATDFVFMNESLNRDDLRIIASIATSEAHELVARRDKGIERPEDLRGKRIGVSFNTGTEFTLMRFLLFNRISPDEVTRINLSPSELVEAISTGEVDAIMSWEIWAYEAKKVLGEKAMSWPARIGLDFYWLLIAKGEFIRARASAIERFVKSLVQAEEFVRTYEAAAQSILANRWKRESAFLEYTWKKNKYVISLDQGLILSLEGEADWKLKSSPGDKRAIPNYLRFIYMDALNAVKPEANTIFR
jgi:ABC-type nitrate/sulfonate/bicarbonate transport system substrate-binding protein